MRMIPFLLRRLAAIRPSVARAAAGGAAGVTAAVLAAVIALGLPARTAVAAGPASGPSPWAEDLREQVMQVPVEVADGHGRPLAARLPVTVFRPAGPGPFPLALINHGRDGRARASYERQRHESAARYFIRKGFAVAVPLRIGYGPLAAAGDPEASVSCSQPRFGPALEAAAAEIKAVLRFMGGQPDIDTARTVLVGHSVGGMAALAALSPAPAPGIVAVVNISGGHGGRPEGVGSPCGPEQLQQWLAGLGARQRPLAQPVPTLWLYARNDRFFGEHWPHAWARAYQDAGGAVTWRQLPPVAGDGHRLFTEANDLWQPVVDDFLLPLGWPIPGALASPAADDRGRADVEDLDALPAPTPELVQLYRRFLAAPLPRAFAMNGQSRSAFAFGDDAQSRALARCEEGAQAEEPCRLYAVNRTVLWSSP